MQKCENEDDDNILIIVNKFYFLYNSFALIVYQ